MEHVRKAMQFAITGMALVISFLALSWAVSLRADMNEFYSALSTWLLGGALLVLSVTVVGTIAFYAYDIRQAASRRATRERLAEFIIEGQAIIALCHERSRGGEDAPDGEALAWRDEVVEYLTSPSGLGRDFAARFENGNGLPMGMTVLGLPYSRVETYARVRVARLSQIVEALGDASLR